MEKHLALAYIRIKLRDSVVNPFGKSEGNYFEEDQHTAECSVTHKVIVGLVQIENRTLSEAVLDSIIVEHGVSPAVKMSIAAHVSQLLKAESTAGLDATGGRGGVNAMAPRRETTSMRRRRGGLDATAMRQMEGRRKGWHGGTRYWSSGR
uniref:Chalcone-flavonone isomerase family protein n=1 Tax=Oryza nivara TaxID=4536 RepID=A0A0E0IMV2_ORYNI